MAILISPLVSTLQANHCIDMLSNTYGRHLSKQISDRGWSRGIVLATSYCSGKSRKFNELTMALLLLNSMIQYKSYDTSASSNG